MNRWKKENLLPLSLIIITAAAGGGVGVLAKLALREMEPIPFTIIRFALALIVLLPVFFLQKNKLSINKFKKLFWVSLFGAGNILIFIFGIRLTTATSSQIIYTLSPLITGILAYFLLKERLGNKKIQGVLIGFTGALVIVLLPILSGNSEINGGVIGNLLILLAVCSHSLYSVFSKEKHGEFSPIEMTVYFAITTFILSLLILPASISAGIFRFPSFTSILSLLYAGIIGTGGFYLIYQYAIKHSSPTFASMVLYLEPVFTIIWAIGLLNERLTFGFLVGSILIFIGVWFATGRGKEIDA